MFVATKVTAPDYPAPERSGWLVYHLRPRDAGEQQVTPLGFAVSNGETWPELRRQLRGIAYLGDVRVTAEEFHRLTQANSRATPEHMRRVADAVEGS